MKIVYQLCRALSLGVLLGFLGGGLRLLRRPAYSEKQIAAAQRMKSIFAGILKYFTFLFLVLGLVWCFYYLALGLSDPALSEYATNMSAAHRLGADRHLHPLCLCGVSAQKMIVLPPGLWVVCPRMPGAALSALGESAGTGNCVFSFPAASPQWASCRPVWPAEKGRLL